LVAYNIYLTTADVEVAKAIAKQIRESSGGLPAVQAKGFLVEGQAQVSMNLLDTERDAAARGLRHGGAAGRGAGRRRRPFRVDRVDARTRDAGGGGALPESCTASNPTSTVEECNAAGARQGYRGLRT
jgi:hypothetical protein